MWDSSHPDDALDCRTFGFDASGPESLSKPRVERTFQLRPLDIDGSRICFNGIFAAIQFLSVPHSQIHRILAGGSGLPPPTREAPCPPFNLLPCRCSPSSRSRSRATVSKLIASNRLPHLLFYGPPGTGKTTTILAIANRLYGPSWRSMTLEVRRMKWRSVFRRRLVLFGAR